ncbi:MAG: bifunctional uroporphyrinogen-III C-methyltransferase/uroporphyrinogen-III synthase [Frankiaceae bacterium]|nr:bifunctional uroporphyrinogen-III C-methyltransferase/uroporphyrinogen-III synthase [Frankiaceae bacterium]MBV9870218.1 bifunctional uroporphyrinogen-III C-methyltransferase/uroporphyrinogen-III synthase [Frankiaceae bacterium]
MTTTRTKTKPGNVTFIGGGPGDPGLLTIRASEALASADVVVLSRPSLDGVLVHCRDDVEIIDTTCPEGGASKAVTAAAKAGKQVARVFHGDPTVLCAFAEEADACAKAKVGFELVPGVSAAISVPAYAGIPVTDKKSRAVHVLDVSGESAEPDWAAASSSHQTLVLLNCEGAIGKTAAALVEHGRRGDTPIAVTESGTTTRQRTIVSTLDTVERDTASLDGPSVAVVGDVVKLREKLSWWESKPLFGWKVLVPRTKEQAAAMSEKLVGFGAIPVEVPTIAVEPPRTPQAVDRAIRGLVSGRYAWLALTSVNAVKAIREKIEELGLDSRALAGVKIACVGEQTAAAMVEWGIRPELVPSGEQSSEGLLADWPEYEPGYDALDRVLLPRADIATETLSAGLLERGWQVDDVTAYRTVRAAPPPAETREAIKTGGFDAVLFTSSSTVRNLVGIAGKPHASSIIAVIGPQTAKTAAELGLRVDVQADSPSTLALAEGLAAFGRARSESGEIYPPGKANRAKAVARAKRK